MALVETVVGEFGEKVENLIRPRFIEAAFDRAGDETIALRGHLGLDLLAHGAAQNIRLAERKPGENLGNLHHLFLIDDDAEGLLEDRRDAWMDVVRDFLAALHRAIGWDIRHWARPVEGDERDNVLEAVGAHVDQGLAHAGAFKLEDTHRFAAFQHRIGLFVVQGNFREVDRDPAPFQKLEAVGDDRQRFEA